MNKIILSLSIYLVTIIYFIISERLLYLYTLKYYSLLRYISDDRKSLVLLNDYFIKYRLIIRYFRIHVVASSIVASVNILIEIYLLMKVMTIALTAIVIFTIIDFLTINTRLISLEDKIYKTYNNIKEEDFE